MPEEAVSACLKEGINMIIPVSGTDIPSVIGGNTATVDDYTQNHETNAGGDLHYAENEFDLYQLVMWYRLCMRVY